MSSQPEHTRHFEELLEYIKRTRGFDFTGYKRASLARRIDKRMQAVEVEDYERYVDYLEANPGEFAHLFNTVLINVTRFFRDDLPWGFLRQEIVPHILAGKGAGEPIRVWSAGCATGEEAYSLAMTFAEALPDAASRERLKIYATDVDEEALVVARHGTYDERAMGDVPPELRERYFERVDSRFTFRKELRRLVIFGRNDLIQDAPISRIDLLVCRNTLMYFDAETQARILTRFHFALNDEGYLFLGRAETLLNHTGSFVPADLKRRVFQKVARPTFRDRLLAASRLAADAVDPHGGRRDPRPRELAFEGSPVAQLVVDAAGTLAAANERARALFHLVPNDVGRPLQDLELSYRPVELRSRLEQLRAERRPILLKEVEYRVEGELRWFDVQLLPLLDETHAWLGVSVTFTDVTTTQRLQLELEHSHQELESAYEELQSTNEELETTNEELQSTVEELETTNEELQSTNEELETMNEELQATNEELETMNDELRRRSDELNEVNAFLESVFTSVRAGLVVLDRDLDVLVWNARAEDLWGLRHAEVEGASFLALDIGLPVERLKPALRACLGGEPRPFEATLPAINRRGRPVTVRVTGTPLLTASNGAVHGVILFMDELGDRPVAALEEGGAGLQAG
ncbi:MAG TPA: CheR family methyltransferase [Gemmatimonadaceae bacterium]|nr:CheR family methyltransferase [Gemmatimonadaceae bacterium]